MALFNRTKKDSTLPEVEQYYQAERRDRSGLAWLLALVSIAAVALVIVGLFLAGRWAYNRITSNDDVAVETTQEEGSEADGNVEGGDDTQPAEGANGGNTPAGLDDADENGTQQGTVDAPARTDTPSAPTTPRTGSDDLPSTGPADSALIAMTVAAAAGTAHQVSMRRKAQR